MKNVVLIGMPGSGKSTVGVVLAKVLGYRFIDSDLVIQEAEGKLLHEIISEKGIDGFLAVENKINSELEPEHSVIATGGSSCLWKRSNGAFKQDRNGCLSETSLCQSGTASWKFKGQRSGAEGRADPEKPL